MDLELNGDLYIENTNSQLKDIDSMKPVVETTSEYFNNHSFYMITNNESNSWYKLGTINGFETQGAGAIIKCVMGEGQNGQASQNLYMELILKKGWSGGGATKAMAGTYTIFKMYNSDTLSNYKVKIIANDWKSCDIWIKTTGNYGAIDYSVEGHFAEFIPSTTYQSSEPSYGYNQEVKGGYVSWTGTIQ